MSGGSHLGRGSNGANLRMAFLPSAIGGALAGVSAGTRRKEARDACHFHEVIEPMLGRGVEYVGEVRGRDKLQLLGSAAALLNPIRWPEPFGMVMIEAMACRTPVITTRCGAAPEIVDDSHTGYLCESMPDLVEALGKVDEIDRLACRRRVEQCFSNDTDGRPTHRAVRLALRCLSINGGVGSTGLVQRSRRTELSCT